MHRHLLLLALAVLLLADAALGAALHAATMDTGLAPAQLLPEPSDSRVIPAHAMDFTDLQHAFHAYLAMGQSLFD